MTSLRPGQTISVAIGAGGVRSDDESLRRFGSYSSCKGGRGGAGGSASTTKTADVLFLEVREWGARGGGSGASELIIVEY